jgi:hypothetical protein
MTQQDGNTWGQIVSKNRVTVPGVVRNTHLAFPISKKNKRAREREREFRDGDERSSGFVGGKRISGFMAIHSV